MTNVKGSYGGVGRDDTRAVVGEFECSRIAMSTINGKDYLASQRR